LPDPRLGRSSARLPAGERAPYRLIDWPAACGFRFDRKNKSWRKGDFELIEISPKHWRLSRGVNAAPAHLRTEKRVPALAIEDLQAQLREATEVSDAQP
jgi:hypothetical protein